MDTNLGQVVAASSTPLQELLDTGLYSNESMLSSGSSSAEYADSTNFCEPALSRRLGRFIVDVVMRIGVSFKMRSRRRLCILE